MTAETLKPFIKTTSVDYVPASESSASSVHHRNSRYFIVIAASTLIVILIASLLGIAVSLGACGLSCSTSVVTENFPAHNEYFLEV